MDGLNPERRVDELNARLVPANPDRAAMLILPVGMDQLEKEIDVDRIRK